MLLTWTNEMCVKRSVSVSDRSFGFADGDKLRVADLIGFSVGKPQLKRLERLPSDPFPNCVRVQRLDS